MLLSKYVSLNWNSKIKKHYVDLGYAFTKMKDSFEVRVEDLTDGSNVILYFTQFWERKTIMKSN